MGSIAFVGDICIDGHEGYVEGELRNGAWASGTSPETRAIGWTGRHRSACDCGWAGPVTATGVLDGWLPEALDDEVMVAWDDHIAPERDRTRRTAAVLEVADEYRSIDDRARAAIRTALVAGATVAEIADAFGLTESAARARWSYEIERSG